MFFDQLNNVKVNLKPLQIGWGTDYSKQPVMAAEAWQFGIQKPRHAKRVNEIPPKDVSLNKIPDIYDWVNVLEEEQITTIPDIRRIAANTEIDAYIVSISTTEEAGAILYELSKTKIPIIPVWDNWGFAWNGRFINGWAEKLGFSTFVAVGENDVDILLRALRSLKRLRNTKILYIGDIPSHSVNSDISPHILYKNFGIDFRQISMNEYVNAIKNVDKKEAGEISKKWLTTFNVMDEREKSMDAYTSIYIALKTLLQQYDANSLTVDCAYLPSIEYVPCVAAAYLIDEGFAFACEGDINQLIALQLLMGLSGKSGLMGNLFENALHKDIQNNEIVINHDVLPLSMATKNSKVNFRDFHDSHKGSTLFGDIPKEDVTIAGISFDHSTVWLSKGKVSWIEDTVHCRLAVGIKVEDPKRIMKYALGHHQVFTYGNYLEHAELAVDFLGLKKLVL
jgi:hypothetical protein